MKVFISQIYIEPGIFYPFSQHFQGWLSKELTERVQPSNAFLQTYSDDFNLVINVSAKSKITEAEIKGPTVFKRTKDVEFSVFLPHDVFEPGGRTAYRGPLKALFAGIVAVLRTLEINASRIVDDSSALIEHVILRPEMFKDRKDRNKTQ